VISIVLSSVAGWMLGMRNMNDHDGG